MSFSYRQEVSLVQRVELRLEQTLKMELSIAPRLELLILPELQLQMKMETKGVDDVTRVRVFSLATKEGVTKKFVSKRIDMDPGEDPYQEAAQMKILEKKGITVPTLVGVAKSGEQHFLITEFNASSINVGTVMSRPAIFKQFLEYHSGKNTSDSIRGLFSELCQTDQFCLANQMLAYFPIEKQKILKENFKIHLEESGYTHIGLAVVKTFEKEEIGILQLVPKKYFKYFLRPILEKLARRIGKEVRNLHEEGVILKDLSPRNLLVTMTKEGELNIIHTGLKNAHIHKGKVPEREKQVNLLRIKESFQRMSDQMSEEFEKSFLEGYTSTEFEKNEKAAKGLDPSSDLEISASTRKKLQALLSQKNEEKNAPEKKVKNGLSIANEMLQMVLRIDISTINFDLLVDEFLKLLKNILRRPGASNEEAYTYQVLEQLYNFFRQHHKQIKTWSDIEGFQQASFVMDSVLEEYKIPGVLQLEYFMIEAMILRFHQDHPQYSQEELKNALVDELGDRFPFRKQDYTKGLQRLESLGKGNRILWKGEIGAIKKYLKDSLESGIPMTLENCGVVLKIDPADIKDIFQRHHDELLQKTIRESFRHQETPDVQRLANIFGIDFLDLQEQIEKIQEEFPKTEAKEKKPRRSRPKTKKIEVAEIREEKIAPEVSQERTSEKPEVPKETIPVIAEKVPEVPEERLGRLQEAILARIEEDPALSDEQLARELQIDPSDVGRIITASWIARNLDQRSGEVHRLITGRPHIDDQQIQEITGLCVTDIHLIVRPALLSGQLSPH